MTVLTVLTVLTALAVLYAAYLLLLYLAQGRLLYPGAHRRERPPLAADRARREVLWLPTEHGRVEAWLLMPADTRPPVPAAVVGHGNAELIDSIPERYLGLRELGFALLLVEYPGYGNSDGSPSEATVSATFAAAYDALAARQDIDGDRILGVGRSLGGGAVCALARQRRLAALILVSTFSDVPALASRYLAPLRLVRDRYDNLARVRAFDGPVLVIHGRRDGRIPFAHGERLAAAAKRGRLVATDDGHDECPTDVGAFWREVATFLEEHDLASP